MAIRMPSLPERVFTEVRCTDPGLTAMRDVEGVIHLRGISLSDQSCGTELSIRLEETEIVIGLRPGLTAARTAALIQGSLPEPYRAHLRSQTADWATLEILRRPKATRPHAAKESGRH